MVQAKGPARAREIMLSLLKGSKELHLNVRWFRPPTTSTRSRRRTSPSSPVTRSSSVVTASGSAGTRRSPSTASAPASASAATSPPTPRRPPCTRWASTTSSAASTTLRRRPDLHPGPRLPGAYAARSSRVASRGAARRVPSGEVGCPQRHPLVPTPSHAGVLAVPTVSMGLGPINAIYQAMSNKYLANRGIKDVGGSQVGPTWVTARWTRSRAAVSCRSRRTRASTTSTSSFNCNLQRLDGPVRGNGNHPGARELLPRCGWNVIKVVWGREWDDLLARDTEGALLKLMNTTPDGDTRPTRPRTARTSARTSSDATPRPRVVKDYTDEQVWGLKRGGHDYARSTRPSRQRPSTRGSRPSSSPRPSRATARSALRGPQRTHQMKKLTWTTLKSFRDAMDIPVRRAARREPYSRRTNNPARRTRRSSTCWSVVVRSAGSCPSVARPTWAWNCRGCRVRAAQEGFGHAGTSPRHGVRASAEGPAARQGLRSPHRAIIPTRRARSVWTRTSRPRRSTTPRVSTTPPSTRVLLAYKESPRARSSTSASTRRAPRGVHRGGHGVLDPRRAADDPVYVFYSMFGFQRTGDAQWAAGDRWRADSSLAPRAVAPR